MGSDKEALKRYVRKKGLGFFLNAPAEEQKAFNGILFFDGKLNKKLLKSLLA